jgi:phospholipid-binding lipoprotein MlaA
MSTANNRYPGATIRLSYFLVVLAALPGCSTLLAESSAEIPALRQPSAVLREDAEYPLDIYDPLEPFNRVVYNFNALFDEYVFLPLVDLYEFITPPFMQTAISNFFSNLVEITTFINSLLQLKLEKTGQTGARFIINSTVGLAGFWDPAKRLGIPHHWEDFGQTLGYYGLGPGPYLVLPILGPSNLRDGTGRLVEGFTYGTLLNEAFDFDDHTAAEITFYTVGAVNQRHEIEYRYYETGSPFEYDLIRYMYTKKREIEIAK